MPQKVKLTQTYLYAGKTYGPGEVEIQNDDAAKLLEAKEAEFQKYLEEHEPPAPVTPSAGAGERHDPRRRPAVPQTPTSTTSERAEVVAPGDGDQKRQHGKR